MITLRTLLQCDGYSDRLTYQRNVALLAFGKAMTDLITLGFVDLPARLITTAWLNPILLIRPWLNREVPSITCLTTLLLFAGLVYHTVHRLRDSGHPHGLALLAALPFAAPLAVIIACFLPSRRRTVWDLVG